MFDGSGMRPYSEFHASGQFGEASYSLLFELARQELRRFPGLRGGTGDDAVWDVVGDFLVERGSGVAAMLLASASDDNSFSALLRTSLRHWLVDQVRKTDLGALRRRLERLLDEDDRFEVVPSGEPAAGWWRLTGTGVAPVGPPLTDLCRAAWGVRDIRIPAWTSDERRAPAADAESLGRIMLAVLAMAGGSLHPATVVAVFADRLPNALDPSEEPLADVEAAGAAGAVGAAADPAQVLAADEAAKIAIQTAEGFYSLMSPDERRLLPRLDGAISGQMEATGRGKSQTYLRINALKARLRALLGEESGDARILAMGELRRLCGSPVDLTPDGDAGLPSIRGSR